ncbi:MAG: Transglycosylase domain protein [Frankiales bacterium]|nr:Transglycosylase domain protein [Frankiales bacterium]
MNPPHLPALPTAVRRPALVVLLTALVLVLLGATGWALTGKDATLSIDGQPREVSFRGGTVSAVLDAADVSVGEHDSVVPSAGARVEDGARIAVRRGRQLELVVDGQKRTVWVTAASVDEALDQVGLRQPGLALSASRSRGIPLEGLTLEVVTPKRITLTADGVTHERQSTATTVGAALVEQGIALDADDRVSLPQTDPVVPDLAINVARVASERVDEDVAVPFTTERRDDPALLVGVTRQVSAGKAGVERRTTERVIVDGAVESTSVVATTTVTAPVNRVVSVGTKPKPAAAPRVAAAPSAPAAAQDSGPRAGTGSAGLNWAALAQCESGGNPRAVNPSGTYRGLYQFSLQTWRGVGGSGDPIDASSGEQTYRAQLLYDRSGAGQWPECGRRLFS